MKHVLPDKNELNESVLDTLITQKWKVKRLKFILEEKLRYGANEEAEFDDINLPRYIRITDFSDNGELRDDTFKSLPKEIAEPYLLKDGDVLLARSGATVGKSFIYRESYGKAAYAGYLIRARVGSGYCPNFLYYYLQSKTYWDWINSNLIQATIQNVSGEKYANLPIPVPNYLDQVSVCKFLDLKVTQIDDLIAKKKKLLNLLEEKRVTLITQAVTKGLDPTVKMNPSGVNWLGEIPEHWELKKLKYIVNMKSGEFINADQIEPEGEYAVMGGNGLRGYTNIYTHQGEFILIGRQGALCGNINIGEGKFYATEHAIVLTPINDICLDWLSNMLEIMNLSQYSMTAAQPGLSVDFIKNLLVPVPSNEEQLVIGELIRCETLKIKALQNEIRIAIKILLEYRISIITSAVTGKIDVRDFIKEQKYEEKVY